MNRVNTNFEINDIYKISKDFILTKDRNIIECFLSNSDKIKTSFTDISDHDVSESESFKSSLGKFLFLFSLEINRNISKQNITSVQEYILVKIDEVLNYDDFLLKDSHEITVQKSYLNMRDEKGLDELNELNKELPGMEEDCVLSIGIPVYREGQNIYKALYEYTKKQLDSNTGSQLNPNKFEIVLLLNAPNLKTKLDKKTEEQINKFQEDYPEYNIYLIKKHFNFKGPVKMGEIYKTVADVCLYRSVNRKGSQKQKEELMLRTGAGDAKDKNKYFLSSIISKAENEDYKLGRYRSESRLPEDILVKFPMLHMLYFMESGLNRLWTKGKSNIGLGTYSGYIYAKVGGFNEDKQLAEDMDLSQRLLKGIEKEEDYVSLKTLEKNAIDDPRRSIMALFHKNKKSIIGKYDDMGMENIGDEDWDKKVLDQDLPDYLEFTQENMEREISKFYREYLDNVRVRSGTFQRWTQEYCKENNVKSVPIDKRKDKIYEIANKLFSRIFTLMGLQKSDYELARKSGFSQAHIEIKNFDKLQQIIDKRSFDVYTNFSE
ncbi:MAG: hypothetical protein GY828_01875 [Candidatus Gracilibacteria bacterium]|nr:hypothetical protein [Candidatus Gracilibacteria bacterium]